MGNTDNVCCRSEIATCPYCLAKVQITFEQVGSPPVEWVMDCPECHYPMQMRRIVEHKEA